MAKVNLGEIAERLFNDFVAPLVIGGEMKPGRPIGGRAALALGVERTVTDIDRLAHVQLARIRVARKLCPLDRVDDATPLDWALASCLHDLVQSTHPSLKGLFSGKAPDKLADIVDETLALIPAPGNVRDALMRHTWFSRMFDIARTDTNVSWWVGSQTFLGEAPPQRLMAWPELRRVQVQKTPRSLVELTAFGGHVDRGKFLSTLGRFLTRTPLTDLATIHRTDPAFQWGAETLGLVATRTGRTIALRAIRDLPEPIVSAALGRATRAILPSLDPARAWPGTFFALALLGDLMLEHADRRIKDGEQSGASQALSAQGDEDIAFARSAGALVAHAELTQNENNFPERQRAALLSVLRPLTESGMAHELEKASSYFLPPAMESR